MSFFTFNSEPHRRFVLWLLALVVFPVAVLSVIGIYLQPLYGDLTRVGFYSEREFGWNSLQVVFQHTQLKFPALLEHGYADSGSYVHYHDVLVLGDSFSYKHPESQWQNYIASATNESVATLYIGKITLAQVLESRIFREHPPKVLILESVERRLPAHLTDQIPDCANAIPVLPLSKGDMQLFSRNAQPDGNLPGKTMSIERKLLWKDVKLDWVRGFLWNNLVRKLTGKNDTDAVKVDFNRTGPFSSNNQGATLVYVDDFKKFLWWKTLGLSEMSCRIEAMRRQVEANGYTRFVLMVPPDKLTAYSDYLSDSRFQHASLLSALSELHPKVMPRLDKALITAIHAGEQDVYFPDDTHWASNGQRIAAETLISFMKHPKE